MGVPALPRQRAEGRTGPGVGAGCPACAAICSGRRDAARGGLEPCPPQTPRAAHPAPTPPARAAAWAEQLRPFRCALCRYGLQKAHRKIGPPRSEQEAPPPAPAATRRQRAAAAAQAPSATTEAPATPAAHQPRSQQPSQPPPSESEAACLSKPPARESLPRPTGSTLPFASLRYTTGGRVFSFGLEERSGVASLEPREAAPQSNSLPPQGARDQPRLRRGSGSSEATPDLFPYTTLSRNSAISLSCASTQSPGFRE